MRIYPPAEMMSREEFDNVVDELKIQQKLGDSYFCFLCDRRPETRESNYMCRKCSQEENE